MAERVEPEMLAYTFSEHVHDTEPDPDAYLRRFLEEMLTLEPGLRQHVSDVVIGDMKEEIAGREDSRHAHAVIELIRQIEDDWRNNG